jgi:hypothetical protein
MSSRDRLKSKCVPLVLLQEEDIRVRAARAVYGRCSVGGFGRLFSGSGSIMHLSGIAQHFVGGFGACNGGHGTTTFSTVSGMQKSDSSSGTCLIPLAEYETSSGATPKLYSSCAAGGRDCCKYQASSNFAWWLSSPHPNRDPSKRCYCQQRTNNLEGR